MRITSIDSLRAHVRLAVQVEMSTIPPYLYALYSLKDQHSDAAALIKSVAAEEMLHVVLTSNLELAIGGNPRFYDPTVLTTYPSALPHHAPELIVNLEPCSRDVVQRTFMVIEAPSDTVDMANLEPEADVYGSLGEFYSEVEQAVEHFAATRHLFAEPQEDRQLGDPSFYSPVAFDADDSGGVIAITDIESARRALDTIIDQGEGIRDHHWADPAHQELTHYYKFKLIGDGERPIGEVWPLVTNPSQVEFGPDVERVASLFDALYGLLLLTLDGLFQPVSAGERGALIGNLYRLMSGVMGPVGRFLVTLPVSEGAALHAGPRFRYYPFTSRRHAVEETIGLANAAAEVYQGLAEIPEALEQIGSLQ